MAAMVIRHKGQLVRTQTSLNEPSRLSFSGLNSTFRHWRQSWLSARLAASCCLLISSSLTWPSSAQSEEAALNATSLAKTIESRKQVQLRSRSVEAISHQADYPFLLFFVIKNKVMKGIVHGKFSSVEPNLRMCRIFLLNRIINEHSWISSRIVQMEIRN